MRPKRTSTTRSDRDTANDARALLQGMLRFLHALRFRKHYIIATLTVATLLGVLYYSTATRLYEGTASLLVTQTGSDVWDPSLKATSTQDSSIPTWEKLLTSNVVLNDALKRVEQLSPDTRIDFATTPRDEWIDVLRSNLSAEAMRRTNVIEVRYRSMSPLSAHAMLDAVVSSYLEFMTKTHKDVSVEIVGMLDTERKNIETRLLAKQKQLLDVKRRVRDLGLREGSQVTHPIVQRVVTLNDTWVSVQKQRVQLDASLAALRAAYRNGTDLRHHLINVEPLVGRQMIMSAMGISPESNENINQVERNLIEDRSELDVMLAHYGPHHPEVVKLQQTIYRTEQYLDVNQEKTRARVQRLHQGELGPMLIAMVEEKLAETKAHEAELATEYAASENEAVKMNDRLAELQIIEDELDRLRAFHKSLLNKITQVDINQGRSDVRIAVVSEPTVSDQPVTPKLLLVILMCLVAGVGSGAGLIYIYDLMDDRFRSPEELTEQLGVPVLTMIRPLPAMANNDADSLPVRVAPRAVESEAFRTLRTTLALSDDPLQRVAITSCQPSDGKTTVLANLGATYAQAGKRTLLIDADLRKPGLTRMLDLRGVDGLLQILQSDDKISQICRDVIVDSGVENLDVIASGGRPADPSELLGMRRMADLLTWAEQHYDQVLIDCPPILAASDATIVGRLVDGVILVVQPSKNHRRVILRGADELSRMKVNVAGVVVNRVEEQEDQGYYGSYGYGYGYGYGVEYGTEDADDVTIVKRAGHRETPKSRSNHQMPMRRSVA